MGGIFHSVTQLKAVPGVVGSGRPGGTCLGRVTYPIYLRFPRLRQGGKADRTCHWGEAWALCSPDLPHSALSLPTQVRVEAAHWFSRPPGSRQRCFKGPRFQHLLRNKVPRCDSGIHLAGTGKGAAICCPIPPLPHLNPGKEGVEEVGQGVEETQPSLLTRRWFGEGLLLPGQGTGPAGGAT